jgi:hypothetical protein
MTKGIKTIIILLVCVVIAGAGFLFLNKNKDTQESTNQSRNLLTYENQEYGFSFTYPDHYFIEERQMETGSQRHPEVVLIRAEDIIPPEGGEGPPSIVVQIFRGESNVNRWITTSQWSNWRQAISATSSTTLGGSEAQKFSWDGLYVGETIAVEHRGNILAFSGSHIHPDDPIRNDFNSLIGSVRLFERQLTDEEASQQVEDHIKANISSLSPEKEVLGGTFYITKIEVKNNSGTVSYEDGHNAYDAIFTWNRNANGNIEITSFEIIQ